MVLEKVNYEDGVTVIPAKNLNDIQDAILEHERSKAPGGFGLGGVATDTDTPVEDANNCTGSGWYHIGPETANGVNAYGVMRVDAYNDQNLTQTAYTGLYSSDMTMVLKRSKQNNVWKPWEYENYPLHVGAEYLTTERHNGKCMYARLYNFGAAAETNWWSWGDDVSGVCNPVRVEVRIGTALAPFAGLEDGTYKSNYLVNHNGFSLYVAPNMVGQEVTVTLWYTKL